MLFPRFVSPFSTMAGSAFRWSNVPTAEQSSQVICYTGRPAGVCPHFEILEKLAILAGATRNRVLKDNRYCGNWEYRVCDIRAWPWSDKGASLFFPEMFCLRLYQELRKQLSVTQYFLESGLIHDQVLKYNVRLIVGPGGETKAREFLENARLICEGSSFIKQWNRVMADQVDWVGKDSNHQVLFELVHQETSQLGELLGFEAEPDEEDVLRAVIDPDQIRSKIKCELAPGGGVGIEV